MVGVVLPLALSGCAGSIRGFGIAESPWYAYDNGGNAAYLQRLNLMQQLGASSLRVDFPPTVIGTPEYNNIYDEATSRGIKIIALANSPYPSDTAAYVRNLLTHYPAVAAIEMGNEQNLGSAGTDGFVGNPAAYAATLGAAFDAKEQLNRSIPLLIGGMAAWGPGDPAQTHGSLLDPYWYLNGILGSGAAAKYRSAHGRFPWDGIGIHPYADWSDNVKNGQPIASGYGVLQCHLLARSKGDPGIMWDTEFGYSTTSNSASADPAVAAQWLSDFGTWWKNQPWTGAFMYYDMDTSPSSTGREAGFGLIDRSNGKPAGAAKRATFAAFSRLAHA